MSQSNPPATTDRPLLLQGEMVMDLVRSELEPKHMARFRGLERAADAAR